LIGVAGTRSCDTYDPGPEREMRYATTKKTTTRWIQILPCLATARLALRAEISHTTKKRIQSQLTIRGASIVEH
jgi:hypothetical protein